MKVGMAGSDPFERCGAGPLGQTDNQELVGRAERPFVLYGITTGKSAFSLLRGQLNWLRETGWRVELATSPDEAAWKACDREGIVLRPLPMNREIAPFADSRALLRWLKLIARLRPDVVNVSTPKAALLGVVAAWLQRVPRRVYVLRGLRVEGARGAKGALLWLMELITMKLATDVIFVSRSLAEEARAMHLFQKKKSWLVGAGSSNGVDSHAIGERISTVDREGLRREIGFECGDFVVGYIGRLTYDKGIDTLVDAILDPAIDKRVRLLTVGPVEDKELAARVAAIGNRVRTVAWTDDPWKYLPLLDVLCLPTLREGFPNVVLEAAAAGVPAITTRATGAIDSVVDGVTGVVFDSGDIAELVDCINRLSKDPKRLQEMGLAAKERAASDFQPERIWQGVQEILGGQGSLANTLQLETRQGRSRAFRGLSREESCSRL